MKKIIILFAALAFIGCKDAKEKELTMANDKDQVNEENKSTTELSAEDIYQFKVKTITNGDFDFTSLKGKKILVVNTASKCGLTPQYAELQKLYDTYKDQNFAIVGFPANNFGKQEPGTNTEIAEFCEQNYGVSFPMMAKISVKGDDIHPLYQFLTKKEKNGVVDSEVAWNFQKYLIDENGKLVKVIQPKTLPTDESITLWIES